MTRLPRGSTYTLPLTDYQELHAEVTKANCFARAYFAHALHFSITVSGLLFSAYLITVTDTPFFQIINALLAAFFSVQLGLLGHSLAHDAVFHSRKKNQLCALLIMGLGCGLSASRWFYKHNAHHQSPNHIGHDPDLEIPFIFSYEQALLRSAFCKKYIFPWQGYLFWIGLSFVYPYNILNSMRFLFNNLSWQSAREIVLMGIHFILTVGFTFWFLPPFTALLFNLVVFLTIGLYMGLVFAPNHKGEDMLAPEQQHNWVHQITLTRNLIPSPLLSYVCGGLEYQIEHHLFPTMSPFHYATAQPLVKRFCARHTLPYKEVTWFSSLREIHTTLHAEAQRWR